MTRARLVYVAYVSTLLLLSAAPAWSDPSDDGYPFSTYPMFASRRTAPTFAKAEGRLSSGQFEPIAPQLLGTDEVMQAVSTVKRATRKKTSAGRLCRSIFAAAGGKYEEVFIVQVKYDPIIYFTAGPQAIERDVVASCDSSRKKGKKKRRRSERR